MNAPAGPPAGDGGIIGGRQPRAVQSALRVLEAVAVEGDGVTAKQIAQRLGMAPATVYRLVNILVAEEYLVRLPGLQGFALGVRMGVFVDAAGAGEPTVLVKAARDVLAGLRLRVRVGIHLVTYRGDLVRFRDVDQDFPPPVGEAQLNQVLDSCALGELRAGGAAYVHRREDVAPGCASLAVAVTDETGHVHAAVWLVGAPGGVDVAVAAVEDLLPLVQGLDPLLR
ncbi:helix-turn-helix domain-containing protein [Nocardioides bruguierae]|uniref:Helix-turn-helix domain-containing protein n=1 Tax=Nocardioides bruguierae TaxID=2945102 RepID=A0A9X2IF86_9ACTN|nr:helix-turn-helix domain-containing protein [Nocardioides bruguierae]MCM0621067.1 helix-turn-helix domain-containing protein [Nocardioides bruguierae]